MNATMGYLDVFYRILGSEPCQFLRDWDCASVLQGSQYKGMLQSCLEIPAVEKMRGPQSTVDRPEMVKVHIRVEQFL